ncbi:MAG: heavy-metal-associated domain-containing protein [Thioalkalivibrionaceae bacterium]
MRIEVENIKCGGCAASIRKGLLEIDGVQDAQVDVEAGAVEIQADDTARPAITEKLAKMGYPETGSVHGIKSASAKAKSFVSCAVGRMQKD